MNKIVYLNDNEAQVSKAFEKRACIFGTDEFYRWQEYKAMFPNAKMVVKKINRNPNQKTRRNLTYINMEEYIRTFPEAEVKTRLAEFGVIKARSHVQKSPYQYVLNWFLATFQNYDNFQPFMEEKEQERAKAEQEATQDTAVPQLMKTAC